MCLAPYFVVIIIIFVVVSFLLLIFRAAIEIMLLEVIRAHVPLVNSFQSKMHSHWQ